MSYGIPNHNYNYNQHQNTTPYPQNPLPVMETTTTSPTEKQPPYPTMPYPGFAGYHNVNSSTDSIGHKMNNRDETYNRLNDTRTSLSSSESFPPQQLYQQPASQPMNKSSTQSSSSNQPINQVNMAQPQFQQRPIQQRQQQQIPQQYKQQVPQQIPQQYKQPPPQQVQQQIPQHQHIPVQHPQPRHQPQQVPLQQQQLQLPQLQQPPQQHQQLYEQQREPVQNGHQVNQLTNGMNKINLKEQPTDNVSSLQRTLSRFNKIKDLVIQDYQSGKFQPDLQLDWVKILLEMPTNNEFIKTYNINGELIGRDLTSSELKKNEHVFIKQAIKILKKICSDTQYAEAQFILGSLYSNSPLIKVTKNNLLDKNYSKSFEYYQKASIQGHQLATYRLGVSYELGIGCSCNDSKALKCFIQAANLGSIPSMFKLGVIYSRGGLGCPRSAKESWYWLQKASKLADIDNAHSVFEIAKFYERCDFNMNQLTQSDVEFLKELDQLKIYKDDSSALQYYKTAAKLQYPPAQYKLGWCYEYGKLGCNIDAKKSIGWYSRSAQRGNPEAEMALSGWYLTGARGILEPNDREAYLWAFKAAESGFIKAEYAIGYYYEVGLGCEQDLEMSRKFYLRAATKGHEKAIEKLKKLR